MFNDVRLFETPRNSINKNIKVQVEEFFDRCPGNLHYENLEASRNKSEYNPRNKKIYCNSPSLFVRIHFSINENTTIKL